MTIKNLGGVFGRNPTFNDVTIEGQLTFDGDIDISSDLKVDGDLTVTGESTFYDNIYVRNDTAPAISIFDSNGGFSAATLTSENGGRDLAIFAPQDIIFDQDGLETARFIDGGGLCFNGDTAAANALDDYEEGTFVPTYTTSLVDFDSVTYAVQYGNYVKIGSLVFVTGFIRTSAITVGSATGTVRIGGLPFARTGSHTPPIYVSGLGGWTGDVPDGGLVFSDSTIGLDYRTVANGGTTSTAISDLNTAGNNDIRFGASYRISY